MASVELNIETLESQFPKLFYVTETSDAYNIIREYELKTVSKFITYRETRGFANGLPLSDHIEKSNMKKGHKILWEDGTETTEKIPYDGIPYIVLGSKIMDCMYGPDRTKTHKANAELELGDLNRKKKTRGESRKRDCPAQLHLREVHKFPEYKIPFSSPYNRRVASKGLRLALLSGKSDIGKRRIYIALPRLATHRGHPVGQESEEKFSLDPKVRDKVHELVYQRVFNTEELQSRAYAYVEDVLFKGRDPPPRTNRRYFPTVRVIKSHCYQARIRMRNRGIDAPLPKETERMKGRDGLETRTLDESSSKGVGNEGNVAADSLLLLDRPIREEEVDTTKGSYGRQGETAGNLTDIDSMLLDKEELGFSSVEQTDCLAILNHLKELTQATSDRETLLEVKGHLLDAMNKFHSPLMMAAAEDPPVMKRKKIQLDVDFENSPADQFIPLRIQKDPASNKPVVIIDQDNWAALCQPGSSY